MIWRRKPTSRLSSTRWVPNRWYRRRKDAYWGCWGLILGPLVSQESIRSRQACRTAGTLSFRRKNKAVASSVVDVFPNMSQKRWDSLFQQAPGSSGFVGGHVGESGALGASGNLPNARSHERASRETLSWPNTDMHSGCVLQLSVSTTRLRVGMQLKWAPAAIEVHASGKWISPDPEPGRSCRRSPGESGRCTTPWCTMRL